MSDEKKSKGGVWQFIKFALFSASAGIIQILSFTLMSEVIIKLPFLQRADVPYCTSSFCNLEFHL